ncbi:hypothetical protein [Stenotrophomonas tumulicola]|uniref:Uncharacterized protein n=1 Tax=Stenotrophomonas tumulicola TaxID=1685415 RepID=A0A7W3FJ83_9GAMM|nr:hypothetical protein [Stenotrophomonas tumulicola]MBA8680519.1 hypothetical protein [Stenotrophomonas tumulicola]
MNASVHAFIRKPVGLAPRGSLVFVEGGWALRTWFETPNGDRENILYLTGDKAGSITLAPDIPGLVISEEYSADFRVGDLTSRLVGEDRRKALNLLFWDDAPELWGHISSAPEHKYGFNLNGAPAIARDYHESYPSYYVDEFEVWLMKDGVQIGEESIFKVGE